MGRDAPRRRASADWHGFRGAMFAFVGLAGFFVLSLIYAPWLNPGFMLVVVILVPVIIAWRQDARRDPDSN